MGHATTSILRGATRGVESEMGNFVTDAMRGYVGGVDFAFTNAGGLRPDIDAGPITRQEIYAVLPFNNTLVTPVTLPDGSPLDPAAVLVHLVHYPEHHSPVDPQVEGRLTVG